VKETCADNHQPQTAKDEHVLLAPGFLFLFGNNCFLSGLASARPHLGKSPFRQQQQNECNPESSSIHYQHTAPRILV
jgi:hypothetical protein